MENQASLKNIQTEQVPDFAYSKIILSELRQYLAVTECSPISIKIVLRGEERYRVENHNYRLSNNSYIIVNQGDQVETAVNSKETVNGLCIFPPIDLVNDVFSSYSIKSRRDPFDASVNDSFFTTHLRNLNQTNLGKYLNANLRSIIGNKEDSFDFLEFYIGIAEAMSVDQLGVEKMMAQLSATKRHTKEELFRRMMTVKDYIHDNQNNRLDLKQLSELSHLSKYHFLRSFKKIFRKSPYQYLLSLKIQKAEVLLKKGYSYNEITEMVGFSDVKNLRKAVGQRDRA
ncbi:hypothetical protein FUAX_39700 (plasmid) [Fulvitalea axinellae]|uniref:HTH araC/xylS-type domain-containing protein n=1 Tax=Fulvitalea axinellae TaxID=1182444 RepID=A0AAU9CTY8_9BACT|nr:hypothetical protein FUAX_39700 [Fulvitalea axinellae]